MTTPTHEPRCPRCGTTVEPDWDWCHACDYDPAGKRSERRAIDPPPRRNVYDPDARSQPVPTRVLVLVGALVLASVAAAVTYRLVTGGPSSPGRSPFAVTAVDINQGATELDDGWWKVTLADGAIGLELPGPMLRTRADLEVDTFGRLPMAVWGNGRAGDRVYAVAVAELPDDWAGRVVELLEVAPLPVSDVTTDRRTPGVVADRPSVAVEATTPDGPLRATMLVDGSRLLIVIVGDQALSDAQPVLDRMVASLTFS